MTTDKLAAGGDVNEQPICALHRIFFTKRGEDCALCGTARRAGEGSQAAPPTLNIEVANLVAAVRLTVQHFKRSANSGNFLGDDEHECWTALENALKPVAAAAGIGTFAAPDVDKLAQVIREVDGGHKLGAGALAEAIIEKGKVSRWWAETCVEAANGRGFAAGIEAAARKVEQVVGGNWTAKFTKTMCAEIRKLAQGKREPAP